MFFFLRMTHGEQKYHLLFYVFTYIFENDELFLQKNNKDIFFKIRSKFDKGLDFQNLFFKMFFNQITLKYKS